VPADAELPEGAEFYLDAFWQLSTDRPQSGFGVHPIPFRALDVYARRYGIEGENFDDLASAVRGADAAFLDVMVQKIKDETAKRGK